MLVTFVCDAHENIIMFGEIAIRLLKMMGQSGTVPSAMLAENVPEALMRLTEAIEQEKKHPSIESVGDDDDPHQVSLVYRALPLMQLLQAAAKKKCNVMWM